MRRRRAASLVIITSMKIKKFLLVLCSALFVCTACGAGDGEDEKGIDTNVNLTVNPTDIQAKAEGGSFTLDLDASREWSAFATSSEPWIKVSPSSGSAGKGSVTIELTANTAYEPREGEVTVKAGSEREFVKVSQEASMKVETTSIYSPSAGTTVAVVVNAPGDWKAESKAAWISATKADAKTLSLTTAVNDAMSSRTGQVVVSYGSQQVTIEVQQGSADDRNIVVPLEGYHLVWHDEFGEGTALDPKTWSHEVKNSGWVNHELQNYVNQTSPAGQRVTEIVDGKLQIHCFKENGKVYSGRVYAQKNTGWQYGYVEAKIMLPSGKGTWPAFWMMPVHFTSWPHDGEIDIMEEVGYHKDYVSSSLHADGHVHSNNTQVTKEVYCKGAEGEFHVYGMEWTPDYFQFYVDGKKTLYYKNPGTGVRDWPYDAPFYVILNLAWGGDWGGSQGVDESALPVTMHVDYVRVFQKND